ncbi:zinc finger HIT domain-containing protein 1 [Chironomus tepperi]|uniref:zinc finger HIT domain-containing protein 1 n=1 Tax=Chironomus tepperi TaxID=113505 RepID=UPI00391F37E3
MATRESGRIKDVEKRRVLDDLTRKRRARKALEALEQDNFHEDPHADLVMSKKIPKFNNSLDNPRRKGRKSRGADYYRIKYRKTFQQLLEEDRQLNADGPNYSTAQAPETNFPQRHFCAVCGFPSNYTCVSCGTRFCCLKCQSTHQDTRCLKFVS